jgi:hypothetical protein
VSAALPRPCLHPDGVYCVDPSAAVTRPFLDVALGGTPRSDDGNSSGGFAGTPERACCPHVEHHMTCIACTTAWCASLTTPSHSAACRMVVLTETCDARLTAHRVSHSVCACCPPTAAVASATVTLLKDLLNNGGSVRVDGNTTLDLSALRPGESSRSALRRILAACASHSNRYRRCTRMSTCGWDGAIGGGVGLRSRKGMENMWRFLCVTYLHRRYSLREPKAFSQLLSVSGTTHTPYSSSSLPL